MCVALRIGYKIRRQAFPFCVAVVVILAGTVIFYQFLTLKRFSVRFAVEAENHARDISSRLRRIDQPARVSAKAILVWETSLPVRRAAPIRQLSGRCCRWRRRTGSDRSVFLPQPCWFGPSRFFQTDQVRLRWRLRCFCEVGFRPWASEGGAGGRALVIPPQVWKLHISYWSFIRNLFFS